MSTVFRTPVARKRALEKIRAMVPRLASDQDGEVVATVRAIGRTLVATGMDWHDFAKLLEERPVSQQALDTVRPPRRGRDPDAHKVFEIADDDDWMGTLSTWEQTFIQSVRAHLHSGRTLSDRQREIVERIYRKPQREWGE